MPPKKDNCVSQQAKGLQIAHSVFIMILYNSTRTVIALKEIKRCKL